MQLVVVGNDVHLLAEEGGRAEFRTTPGGSIPVNGVGQFRDRDRPGWVNSVDADTFAFGTPPPPCEFRLIGGRTSRSATTTHARLLPLAPPRDEIALRAAEMFVPLVESSW